MSHPETWAPLGGTYVSPRDVGKKKKTRPARGDICLTQGCGQRNDPCGAVPCPLPLGLEERLIDAPPSIKGGHRSLSCPPQIRREGLIVAPPSNLPQLRGDIGAHPMSP